MRLFGLGKSSESFSKNLQRFARIKVGDEMTKEVMTISPDDSLIDAANIMIGHHISSLIVVNLDSKKPIGIITERDFINKAPSEWKKLRSLKVKDIITNNPMAIQPSLSLMDANDIMEKHGFRKLIVTKNDELAGVITQTDILKKLNSFYSKFRFSSSDNLTVNQVKKKAVKVAPTEKISRVRNKIIKANTGTAFVINKNLLLGLFTEYDFLSELAMQPEQLSKIKVGDAMSFPVVGINSEVDVYDAIDLTLKKGFRRMPIFESGKFAGKVTQRILMKAGFDILKKTLQRKENKSLKNVDFRLIEKKELVRRIAGKVQEFRYADT